MKSIEIPFGDHLGQVFAKHCFLTHKPGKRQVAHIKKYVPFPCKGKQLGMNLSPGMTRHYQELQTWADPLTSRNRKLLPMNQKLALTTQHKKSQTEIKINY